MRKRKLGVTTRIEVSPVGLGAMPLSVRKERPSEKDAIGVIRHAVDCGVTLIDTADAYCLDDTETGHNERLIGKALKEMSPEQREEVVVATKGGNVRPEGRWEPDGSPEHLRSACEASLKNLGLDSITLYQLHRPDPNVPLADSLGALRDLQTEGKIEHIGVSNFSLDELEEAEKVVSIISVQNRFSPAHRDPETDGTMAASLVRGWAFLPWSPLNGMDEAKNIGKGEDEDVVMSLASDYGVSPQALTLAWLMSKAPHIIPIPGASRKESIEDSLKAGDISVSLEDIQKLNQAWGGTLGL